MPEQTVLFISYKTGPTSGLTFQARAIKKELESKGGNYHVWFDKDSLEAGLDWNTQIYRNIPRSDILLLLLAEETANSDWVRREIDVAKGAQVTILPVLIRGFDDLQGALDRFDIARVQAVSLYEGSEDEYEKLFTAIEQRKDDTRKAQRQLLENLDRRPQRQPAMPPDSKYRVYEVGPKTSPDPEGNDSEGLKVHLAAGDIMAMRPIDVFVNSENDYMQMARMFDDQTISSLLRLNGSHFDDANRLLDDTLQNELTDQVKDKHKTRPVGMGTVIATAAGHAESRLRKWNKARFVFHAAVVSVRDNDKGKGKILAPSGEQALRETIRKTLDMVNTVNKERGVPGSTKQEKQRFKPIESIIFPLLGTGSGGLPVGKVASLMGRTIKEFILDELVLKKPNEIPEGLKSLKRIYISVYMQDELDIVDEALKEVFASETPEEANREANG